MISLVHMSLLRCSFFLFIASLLSSSLFSQTSGPTGLSINEGLIDPIGFHDSMPRFSWKLRGEPKGSRQSAYQIVVSSEQEKILWDSGRVESDQSVYVPYAGRAFNSRESLKWRVRYWGKDEQASSWSEWAQFEMGLLRHSDWKAKWIHERPKAEEPYVGTYTITQARYGSFAAGAAKRVVDVTDRVSSQIDVSKKVVQSMKVSSVMSKVKDPDVGVAKQLLLNYTENGKAKQLKVTEGQKLRFPPNAKEPDFGAVVYMRKQFKLDRRTVKGRLYVTAKGNFEIEINGQRVGHDVFVPGFTDYHKRIETLTYDVTDLVCIGENVISAKVANGWYAGRLIWNDGIKFWGDYPELLVQLECTNDTGKRAQVVSDATWKYTDRGPIVMADIYNGEDYDARLEVPAWNLASFDESLLSSVGTTEIAGIPILAPKRFNAARLMQTLIPVGLDRRSADRVIFDLGQNMVGWPQINLPVLAGQEVKIRVAEMLEADGSLYTKNYRSARSAANYIPADDGQVSWTPTFSFFGFRYVEIAGFDSEQTPTLDWLRGQVLYTDFELIGEFTSSDSKLNQLQKNIQWGQRGNFLDIPTDCPQRDERLGWTGDAQVFAATSLYNFDTHAFWAGWLQSVRENQQANGSVSNYVPAPIGHRKGTSPGWGDCAFIIPWELYVRTGDLALLRENYEMMCKRVQWYADKSQDGLVEYKGFGDWLQPILTKKSNRGDTPMQLISTAHFGYGADLCAKAARVLGRDEDVVKYEALLEEVRAAVVEHLLDTDGKLTTEVETQTGYLLLLGFDLVPEELRAQTAAHLSAKVAAEGNRLNTGFLGTPLINRVLDDTGYIEQAFAVLFTNEYPSWFYSIDQGATTMWERWNSYSHSDGFGNAEMNSFNHYAYGAVGQWMYERLAGLAPDPANPGYKHIILRPLLDSPLTSARAEIETRYGKAVSAWSQEAKEYVFEFVIPANTTATLSLPDILDEALLKLEPGFERSVNGYTTQLHAGEHQFRFKVKE